MANAAATPTIRRINSMPGSGRIKVFGSVAIDANPATYQTGGIPFGIAQFAGVQSADGYNVQTQLEALEILFTGLQGAFLYRWDRANAKLRIFIVSTQAEIANGVAIDAAISGDTIDYVADFLLGQ